MKKNNPLGIFSNLGKDLPASLVVFLVALPLCLGIAQASGAELFSGLIAGIVGGIVVATISGSPLGVSGPAAGLAAIVAIALRDLKEFDIFLMAVVIAGVIQIILGLLRAGVIGYYFPNSVIKGMLSGIGITLILKEIPHALGYDKVPMGTDEFIQADGQNTISELSNMLNYISPGAVLISLVSLILLILWSRPLMQKLSFTKVIQGPLIVVVLGILATLGITGFFEVGEEHLVSIPVSSGLTEFIGQFTLPDFSQWNNPEVLLVGATLAIVASLETLLCVEATDKLDPYKRVTPTNRELLAQGTGNMVSGLIGGLPITQVIVRSSANIQSGGKSKLSAIVHGILLLACAYAIPHILNLIPNASLAAILLIVGYKLAKPALFIEMYRKGWSQFLPFIITIAGILFKDLLVGIGLGLGVAIIQILWQNFNTPYHFDPDKYKEGDPVKIQLAEEVTFLNKAGIMHTLDQLPEDIEVIIDGRKSKYIHPDVLEIIDDFIDNSKIKGRNVQVLGLNVDQDQYTSKQELEDKVMGIPKKLSKLKQLLTKSETKS